MTTISNKVKYFDSTMAGAPELSGTVGALISVLDACLVDGFGSKSIDTLTVTGDVASALISGGHDFAEGDVIRIAGATPSLLNSDWRLASATADTVTFSVEGVGIAAGSATGTITGLRAPSGWEKVFSDTNKAAYRSPNHADHNRLILYVDDTNTTTARVRGYESMTNIDTGINPFPTDAQFSGGLWWGKASNTTGSRQWALVGDEKRFGFSPLVSPVNVHDAPSYFFGRLVGAPYEIWSTAILGATSSANALASPINKSTGLVARATDETADFALTIARSADGSGMSVRGKSLLAVGNALSGSSTSYATPLDGYGMGVVYPDALASAPTGFFRYCGTLPHAGHIRQNTPAASNPAFTKIGVTGNGGVLFGYQSNSSRWLLSTGIDGKWD